MIEQNDRQIGITEYFEKRPWFTTEHVIGRAPMDALVNPDGSPVTDVEWVLFDNGVAVGCWAGTLRPMTFTAKDGLEFIAPEGKVSDILERQGKLH